MSKALEQFRLSLQGKPSLELNIERIELIDRGKELAVKLKEYNQNVPHTNYLTSSHLEITRSGLEANRYNINLDRVPIDKIRELVGDGEKRLGEIESKVEGIIEKFSADVAEICFDENTVMSKPKVISKLFDKKEQELKDLCIERIPIHSLAKLDLDIPTINFRIYSPSHSTSGKLHAYSGLNHFEFLSDFENIKAELVEVLDFTFKEIKK